MLQVDPPPKAVKVTMSKRIPLVGDELKAYEDEQERIKKEEELKASHGSSTKASDPMVADASSSRKSSNGKDGLHSFAEHFFPDPIKFAIA
jgi:cleavage and polyadenylation specificity factor subunit 2